MRMIRLSLTGWLLVTVSLHAAPIAWTGGAGTWQTAAKWDLNRVPAATDAITIANGDVEYVAGTDLAIGNTGSLTIRPGGRLFQSGGIAWMQVTGPVVIQGGEFDTGTAQQMNVNGLLAVSSGVLRVRGAIGTGASTMLRFAGGTTYRTGNFSPAMTSRSSFGGGSIEISGEFQYSASFAFGGSTVRARLIAAQAASSILTLTGGHLITTSASYDGLYQQAGCYINFADGSKGKLTFTNCTPANVHARYFSGAAPRIRLNGTAVSPADLAALFDVTSSTVQGNSVDISLKQATAGQGTFNGEVCAAGSLTATSMVMTATINDPGHPAAAVFACHGTANGLLHFASWRTARRSGRPSQDAATPTVSPCCPTTCTSIAWPPRMPAAPPWRPRSPPS